MAEMAQTIVRMGGYQGARSVHTRAGRILGREFLERVGDGYRFEFCEDVTALGRPSTDLFDMVAGGELDLCYFASSYLTHAVPDLAVLDLPFRIRSRAEIHPKLDGALGSRLAEAVARDTAFVSLGYWDNGFRHLSNRVRPIRRPDDCRGLSIRTMSSAVHQEIGRAHV
jgi:TRAP-type C4-dicarboxylate transport system substrate-binding protein